MKKQSTREAVKQAYSNLYTSNIKNVDKNLDKLIKIKKYASINKTKNKGD